MSTLTSAFYAVASCLLGIIAVAVIPTGGWGSFGELARVVGQALTVAAPVFFLGAAILGRNRLGD